MKKIALMLGGLSIISMTGCAVNHACPLPAQEGHCASVIETLNQAKRANKSYKGVSIFDEEATNYTKVSKNAGAGSNVYYDEDGQLVLKLASPENSYKSNLPVPRKEGMPIYRQAEPRQIFLPAWTDANGVLHGDKEVYTLKPGGWNYGTMRGPNAGSEILSPMNPDDYGFEPVYEKDVKKAETKVINAQAQAQQQAQQQRKEDKKVEPIVVDNKTNAQKATATVGGITQPYQKFEE